MLQRIARIWGCKHKKLTWPRMARSEKGKRLGNYQTCIDCGHELPSSLFGLPILYLPFSRNCRGN